jgi:hypothetical protein
MTLRMPNEGEVQSLAIELGQDGQETLSLCLFTNNVTPADTDTLSTYTEASGYGYAAIDLTPANWTITAGSPTEAVYPQQTFTFTGALGDVYGYFVKYKTSGILRHAERFTDGPYSVTLDGDTIKITLKVTRQDTLD